MADNDEGAGPVIIPIKEPHITYQCPVLTLNNYTSWSIKMESILDAQGLWDAVEPPEGTVVDTKIVKRARAFILQSLPEDLLLQVASHKNAKDIWAALKTRYLGADRVQKARIQTLNRDFELLCMKETESIDDMAAKINQIATKIRSLGSSITESAQVKKLLNSVPDKFLPIVASIEQYSDLETMPFEEAIGRLKTYEERVKPCDTTRNQDGQLLLTKMEWQEKQRSESRSWSRGRGSGQNYNRLRGRSRGRSCGRGRGSDNSRKNEKVDQQKDPQGRRDKRTLRCYNCDKIGHFSAECRAPKRENTELNLMKDDDDEQTLLLVMTGNAAVMLNEERVFPMEYDGYEDNLDDWYLDNGASNHMTGHKRWFSDLDEKTVGNVRFGDGSTVDIKGKGSIALRCKNGELRTVSNVYYIPELRNNILSLGQMTETGCRVIMEKDCLRIYEEKGSLLMKVQRTVNRLYKI